MISLFDTLTGRVRPLRLRTPGEVSMYVCGPTVYDHPHLGHARSALTYDVLRRYLQWRGLRVRHVANITDIDDKIIDRARREGRTEPEVAAHWEAVYSDAMAALGVLEPCERPRATEWVGEMIALVAELMAAGGAYAIDAGVYLRVRKARGYGDLVRRSLEELRASAGGRVEVDEAKEDPLDFALWKAAKPGEPSWPSPWGPGRPGWHIECAAMSLGLLGEGFDLHGGGDDLVFPHHTNERAEALAAGRVFAGHWMHNAMLNVGGAKMAKSLGNFRTVADLLDEHPLNGRALRLLVLQTHYRKTMEVNASLIASARTAARRLDALVRRAAAAGADVGGASDGKFEASSDGVSEAVSDGKFEGVSDGVSEASSDGVSSGAATEATDAFRQAMDDDLGTPEATAVVFETLRRANAALDSGSSDGASLVGAVVGLAGALGVTPRRGATGRPRADTAGHGRADSAGRARAGTAGRAGGGKDEGSEPASGSSGSDDSSGSSGSDDSSGSSGSDDSRIESLVAKRQAARRAKDWAVADELRDRLAAMGVTVEDTPAGSIWRRRVRC